MIALTSAWDSMATQIDELGPHRNGRHGAVVHRALRMMHRPDR